MATIYITEHELMIINGVPVVKMPPIATQTVTFAAATFSNPFNPATELVRLNTDSVCSVEFGGNAATTSSARLSQNQTEYFAVRGGDRVSVIANT